MPEITLNVEELFQMIGEREVLIRQLNKKVGALEAEKEAIKQFLKEDTKK